MTVDPPLPPIGPFDVPVSGAVNTGLTGAREGWYRYRDMIAFAVPQAVNDLYAIQQQGVPT
jgi:hypothetical protein